MNAISPYKGLVPYSAEDWPFFFGRDDEREIIATNLMASRLTLLYGASGVGKSSVLNAGVTHDLNQLAQRNLARRGAPKLAIVVFRDWRDDPITGLVAEIRRAVAIALGKQPSEDAIPAQSLLEAMQQGAERVDGNLLVLLDQFEEYFLYHDPDDDKDAFAVEFPRAVNRPDLRANFLISIREDGLAKLDRFKGSIPNLFDNYLRIEHLSPKAARSAIEEPIKKYNELRAADGQSVSIEKALVDEVLIQIQTGDVALVEAGRGVVEPQTEKILKEKRVEAPYLQLVMERLWNEESNKGSREIRLATLNALGGVKPIVRTHLDTAMEKLSSKDKAVAAEIFDRLVTPSRAKITQKVSDLASYTSLRPDRLATLLGKLSEARILTAVAPAPDDPQTPRYEIYHDVLASAILDWQGRHAQGQRRKRFWLIMGAAGLLLTVMLFLVFQAQTAKALAQSRDLSSNAMSFLATDPELSVLLSLEALRVKPTVQAEEALKSSLISHAGPAMRGHTALVNSAVYSPDGKWIATASDDNTARVWEASTGKLLATLQGHTALVISAVFSSDGKWIATASYDKTARVYTCELCGSVSELVELARKRVPRDLTPEERKKYLPDQ